MNIQARLNDIERRSNDIDIYDDEQERARLSADVHELIEELKTELESKGFSVGHASPESVSIKKREENGELITAWLEKASKRTVQTGELDKINTVDVSIVRENVWQLLEPLKAASSLQRAIDELIDMRAYPENW